MEKLEVCMGVNGLNKDSIIILTQDDLKNKTVEEVLNEAPNKKLGDGDRRTCDFIKRKIDSPGSCAASLKINDGSLPPKQVLTKPEYKIEGEYKVYRDPEHRLTIMILANKYRG